MLAVAARSFAPGRSYSEGEVNAILQDWLAREGSILSVDHVELRRWLVDCRVLARDDYGRAYALGARGLILRRSSRHFPASTLPPSQRPRAHVMRRRAKNASACGSTTGGTRPREQQHDASKLRIGRAVGAHRRLLACRTHRQPYLSVRNHGDRQRGQYRRHWRPLYAQTRQILDNIAAALKRSGATLADVVRTRIFVTDIGQWEAVGRAHGEVFGKIRPACTMVQVAKLIAPELLVEIEADAVLSESPE